jgi:hypothetical protein
MRPCRSSHCWFAQRSTERGSLLTTALIFAAALALILGGYLQLSATSMKLANRSFYANAAMNLADAGVERALWTFNQVTSRTLSTANAWSESNGWTLVGGNAYATLTDFELPQNASGVVKVHVQHYNPSGAIRPKIVCQAIITPVGGAPVMKFVEVDCRRRSPFSTAMVAINRVTFNGTKTIVDSWLGVDESGEPLKYSDAVRRNHGSIAALGVAVESGSLNAGNADIYGTVATAGDMPLVGPNGTVSQTDPRQTGVIDPKLMTRDFAANFDDATAPELLLGDGYFDKAITGTTTLGDSGAAARLVPEIDDAKSYRVYSVPEIRLSGTSTLSIEPNTHVVIVLPPGKGTAVQVTGTASIIIPATSSLQIYTADDVNIAGGGVANGSATEPNPAVNFQIWGTRPTAPDSGDRAPGASPSRQQISVAGNGILSATVYAPFADVQLRGHSSATPTSATLYHVQGSVVAYNVTMTGRSAFHYDESLANWRGAAPFGIAKWRELVTAADRALFADRLSF